MEKGKALALTRCPDAQTQVYIYEALWGKRLTVKDWNEYIDALLHEKAVLPEAPTPEPSAEPPGLKCDICGALTEPKWLQSVFMCAECLGIAKVSYAEANRPAPVTAPAPQ